MIEIVVRVCNYFCHGSDSEADDFFGDKIQLRTTELGCCNVGSAAVGVLGDMDRCCRIGCIVTCVDAVFTVCETNSIAKLVSVRKYLYVLHM